MEFLLMVEISQKSVTEYGRVYQIIEATLFISPLLVTRDSRLDEGISISQRGKLGTRGNKYKV